MADEYFPYFEELKLSYETISEKDILNLREKCNSEKEVKLSLSLIFSIEICKNEPDFSILKSCLGYNLIDVNKDITIDVGRYCNIPLFIVISNNIDDGFINSNYYNIVKLLLKYGADPNICTNCNNSSCIDIPILKSHFEIAKLLIMNGGVITEKFTNTSSFLNNYSFLLNEDKNNILEFVKQQNIVNTKPAKRS
jgi:ankyrin repeat protein